MKNKWLNPDFRTKGKGPHCVMCAKTLKAEGGRREVRYFRDEFEAIPTARWPEMTASEHPLGYLALGEKFVEVDFVGPTCAQKLGVKYHA